MKNGLRILVFILSGILAVWILLTFWAEAKGPAKSTQMGVAKSAFNVLVVYDPDPIYNLDEQVCERFGKTISAAGIGVKVATVAAANTDSLDFDAYVFCANTYNWRPDWAVTGLIQKAPIANKTVIAITLGSGSTQESQKALEQLIAEKKGKLRGSKSFWLLRPNDESRMEESNVQVTLSMVETWAGQLAQEWKTDGDRPR